jgi:hypothetical protein
MELPLIVLLAIVAPYPVMGIVFGAVLAMGFYAALILAVIGRWVRV